MKDVATSGSAARLDVLNYAFGNVAPDADGNVVCNLADEWADYQVPWTADQSVTGEEVTWPRPILGNFQQLQALKTLYPSLKVMISLGGWTLSKYFSDAALTDASRQQLVSSCIDLFIKGNLPEPGWGGMGGPGAAAGVFDGIDLDWEWPGSEGNAGNIIRPEDKQNFTKLVDEFRNQLDDYGETTGEHYLLTSFLPAAPAKIDAGFEVGKIFDSLDFATVQGYDLHGAWETLTNHQSNLYASKKDPASPRFSVEDTVRAYLARGAPASELVIGVPFYSRGWTGVAATNRGLYQLSSGPAPGVWESGVNDYEVTKDLLSSGFTRYWDGKAFASWLFDGTTFWTFDDPRVMKHKAHYVLKNNLGGIMFWELSGDTPDGELIDAIADGLSHG
ncbi:MAG TPA: glycoside hydrolase family 18 protein, partial [Gaiellaceae bacterium]|nr:glycoside hydrolase family 18 protein [Gaiellaceae bacterium]